MENDDKYLPELLAEKDSLDSSFTHAMKLLNAGKKKKLKLICRSEFSVKEVTVNATPLYRRTHLSTRCGCHVFKDGTRTVPL